MSDPATLADSLVSAELRARRARDQLQLTVALLQDRLDPRVRARRVVREAQVAGSTAVAIAQDNPAAAGGVVAGSVLALGVFLGRHRIARLFARKRPDTSPAEAGLKPVMRTEP